MHGIGPRPAAATDTDIFTGTAAPLIRLEITHIMKKLRVLPDILEGFFPDISGSHGEVAAWQHIAVHIDKTDKLTCQAPFLSAGGKLQAAPLEVTATLLVFL